MTILVIYFSLSFFTTPNICHAQITQSSIFAQITSPNIYFYNSPSADPAYQLFEIPSSYFVELTGHAQDSENSFYSANYMGISGYVKKSEVSPIQGTPQTPFATGHSFRVFSPSGLDLRSTPSADTPFNRLINVPYLCTDLIYFGTLSGQEMIPDKTSTWIYCKYVIGQNTYHGYLYSALCDKLPSIPQNMESFSPFEGELFATQSPPEPSSHPLSNLPNEVKLLAVAAICLPCIALLYLLFKPTHIADTSSSKPKKKIKRLKRSEFYELDE